jgi:hypothetical protein
MAREGLPDYEYPTQLAFIQKLHARCKCTPTELQSLLFRKFLATVAGHPFAYLRMVWRNFHYLGLAALLADPVATINQFFEFATPIQYKLMPGLSIRNLLALQQHFSLGRLLLMILNLLSTAVAAILFSLFVFGIPYFVARAWRRGEPIPPALAIVAFLWFTFLSVSVAFSLVHYEARHALPIFPAGCIGVVYASPRPGSGSGGRRRSHLRPDSLAFSPAAGSRRPPPAKPVDDGLPHDKILVATLEPR